MSLVDRARNMIVAPAREWPVIAGETPTVGSLYTNYILILAAIGPIAILLSLGFMAGIGLGTALVSYLIGLAMVYVLALVVDFLAPNFGGEKGIVRALQLTAYAATPAWIGGIFHLLPWIGALLALIASAYSIYVFYLGAPVMRKCAPDKAVVFTVLYVVCAIVVGILLATVLFGIAGGGGLHPMGM